MHHRHAIPATSSTEDILGPSPVCTSFSTGSGVPPTSGSTRAAGCHSFNEPFLKNLAGFLRSQSGGRKGESQVKEICTDVSNFLWFADPSKCDPESMCLRSTIRKYADCVESRGIGPSGILTKLRRISQGIQWYN